ncbi:hypothetical protein HCH_02008 [Hahella chejuensis KCTC 2396]|uniref:Uncharacterized protein n=1 Tax=Hahella chejuensis (strain KCTC 2396) TaxID=349521 RepID=Q2SKI2_HAHCH|nr:hypothetical protein HCH_02008 [Hahella chejuensis KCTC 2396]
MRDLEGQSVGACIGYKGRLIAPLRLKLYSDCTLLVGF